MRQPLNLWGNIMKKNSNIKKALIKNSKYILLAIMVIFSTIVSDKFFTGTNISNLLKQNAAVGILALGELLVILTGGIDLSVGAVVNMTTIIVSLLLKQGQPIPIAVAVALASGIVAGLINGILISHFKLIPFIATMATLNIYSGLALLLSTGKQIFYENDVFLKLGNTMIWYIPIVAIIWVILAFILNHMLEHMRHGRYIKGFGGNKEAVRLSGVNITFIEMSTYVVSGFLCAIGGVIMASRLTLGSNSVGDGWELTAIASGVIGGARLTGGVGPGGGVVVGTLVMGLIGNVMNLLNVSIYWQQIIKGLIILVAVYGSTSRKKENTL